MIFFQNISISPAIPLRTPTRIVLLFIGTLLALALLRKITQTPTGKEEATQVLTTQSTEIHRMNAGSDVHRETRERRNYVGRKPNESDRPGVTQTFILQCVDSLTSKPADVPLLITPGALIPHRNLTGVHTGTLNPATSYTIISLPHTGFCPELIPLQLPDSPATTITLPFKRGAEVTGRAVHALTGAPVANARLGRIMSENYYGKTDVDGRFTLARSNWGDPNTLEIESEKPSLSSYSINVPVSPVPVDIGDVLLYPSVNLRVLVLDDAGNPVEGAGIGFTNSGNTDGFSEPENHTNSLGEFERLILPTRPYYIYLYETQERRDIPPSATTSSTERLVQFNLGRASVRAEFFYEGKPHDASAARLKAQGSDIHHYNKLAGNYTIFDTLPPGSYDLEVYGTKDDTLVGKQKVTVAPGESQTVRVELKPFLPDFAIRVTDEYANIVEGAKVFASPGAFVESRITDSTGEARFYDIAKYADRMWFTCSQQNVGTGNLTLDMEELKSVERPVKSTITLRAAQGNLPVSVYSGPHHTPLPGASGQLRSSSGITLYESNRGAIPGLLEFQQILPGEYDLVIFAQGYCPEVHEIKITDNGRSQGCPESVTMTPGAEFCFRGIYADGRADYEIGAFPDSKYKDVAKPTTPRPGAPANHFNLPFGDYTGSVAVRGKGKVPFRFSVSPETPGIIDILLD